MQLTTLFDTLSNGGSSLGTTVPTLDELPLTAVSFADSLSALKSELPTAATLTSAAIPCRVYDSEMWFAETQPQVEQAKALCQACPVRGGCLAGAIDRSEPWGVWGGEVFIDGIIVAKKRGRGRPRKSETMPPLAA